MDDDDLLREVLLRLPPRPSSLPRASLVCKRWRRLVSDPGFLRRFRAHHREPPLIGFFVSDIGVTSFTSVLDPPDRIPAARFSFPESHRGRDDHYDFLGCRHGLALLLNRVRHEAVIWDPITDHLHRVAFPPGFDNNQEKMVHNAAVLCAAGDDHSHVHGDCLLSPFKLILVRTNFYDPHAQACLYESESGLWGNIISTATTDAIIWARPSILVGNTLCWLLSEGNILEFNFERQSLSVIEKPADVHVTEYDCLQILRIEDSSLGLAMLSELSIQLWERKFNSDGVVRWVLRKTIRLDKLLSLELSMQEEGDCILGFDEDTTVIFVSTNIGVLMIELETMQFKNLSQSNFITVYYPYTSFYNTGRVIFGGDDGPEMLNNT